MAEATKRKAHVLSSFTDAGTGESFVEGDTPMIEAGAFGNYKAAGLIAPHSAAQTAAAPAKPKRAKARKPKTAKAAAAAEPVTPVEPAQEIAPSE